MSRINILVAFDKNYSPITGVMLTSLLRSNKDCAFDVYAMVDDSWDREQERRFNRLLQSRNSNLFIYNMSSYDLLNKCPLIPYSHITLPTYFRLMAPEILPSHVSKILYLDGDILVKGDIKPLWNTDLTGYAFAGADDCSFHLKENYERLQYDSKYSYYNAGVTLYNLDFWRNNGLTKKIFGYIAEHHDNILWGDQDAVNGLLHDLRKSIPIIYNFQNVFFHRNNWKHYSEEYKKEILAASRFPVVIHYSAGSKPWQYMYYKYPFFDAWKKTAFFSLWWRSFLPHVDMRWLKFQIKKIIMRNKALMMRNKEMDEVSYDL